VSWALKILGITVVELICSEPGGFLRIDNTGGQFEIAEVEDDYDYEYEEEDSFGFRGPR
jgi:hypothetical protein